jgi:predicted O-methyltransferase YrrM
VFSTVLSQYVGKPNVRVLEIGTYQGRSCIFFLENILTHPSSHITCIDTFEGSKEHSQQQKSDILDIFLHNIQDFAKQVSVFKGKSHNVLRQFDIKETYDIIYIDGDHTATAVIEDAVLTFPLLKKGGFMIFDDYQWTDMEKETDKPKMAVDAFLHIYKELIQVIHVDYQVVIKKL